MGAPSHRCWVEVSRQRIAANFRAVQSTVGEGVTVMPVVKADAYRHGAIEVSRTLVAEGARWLAVSNVEEGAALTPIAQPVCDCSIPSDFRLSSGMLPPVPPLAQALMRRAQLQDLDPARG